MPEKDQSTTVTWKQVAALITVCGVVFGPLSVLTGAYFSLSTRVTVLEQQRIADRETQAEIKKQLDAMNQKLDQLITKRGNP